MRQDNDNENLNKSKPRPVDQLFFSMNESNYNQNQIWQFAKPMSKGYWDLFFLSYRSLLL